MTTEEIKGKLKIIEGILDDQVTAVRGLRDGAAQADCLSDDLWSELEEARKFLAKGHAIILRLLPGVRTDVERRYMRSHGVKP